MAMKPGDSGDAVAAMQRALNRWIQGGGSPIELEPLQEHGVYCEDTISAVALFQQAIDRRATGWADEETLAHLVRG